jgi:hypothetical protein
MQSDAPSSGDQRAAATGGEPAGAACGGAVGGFGIQTHRYGIDAPSPRSSYRPVANCTTFCVGRAGATDTVAAGGA